MNTILLINIVCEPLVSVLNSTIQQVFLNVKDNYNMFVLYISLSVMQNAWQKNQKLCHM